MKKLLQNIILLPVSILYKLITGFRNWLFDIEILKSTSFKTPVISVGNLTVGGTGKTPHTEFLLSFLKDEWKTAILSRGYKRKTNGFVLGTNKSDSNSIGDEPFQILQKFTDVTVAVDEKRVHGVKQLLLKFPDLQTIILDDAFQHRHIQAGFSILLTDYNNLYCRDRIMPLGRLRESKKGYKRADMIIVTKCPNDIQPIEMRLLETELNLQTNQQLFFSTFKYEEFVPVYPTNILNSIKLKHDIQNKTVLLVSGIVSPKPIIEYLKNYTNDIIALNYPDHHNFNTKDFIQINKSFEKIEAEDKIIVVTEKDAARIKSNPLFPEDLKPFIYALPIKVEILNNQESLFIQKIKDYVIENSRNS